MAMARMRGSIASFFIAAFLTAQQHEVCGQNWMSFGRRGGLGEEEEARTDETMHSSREPAHERLNLGG
jgi:hypothetical protein